eukprot:jgi/Botrbrau1/629/Bobra.0161s0020.1
MCSRGFLRVSNGYCRGGSTKVLLVQRGSVALPNLAEVERHVADTLPCQRSGQELSHLDLQSAEDLDLDLRSAVSVPKSVLLVQSLQP